MSSVHYPETIGQELMTRAKGEYRRVREDPSRVAGLVRTDGANSAKAVAGWVRPMNWERIGGG